MKERIVMIAKFQKSSGGLAVAVALLAGLGLVTLTDAQTDTNSSVASPNVAPRIIATSRRQIHLRVCRSLR